MKNIILALIAAVLIPISASAQGLVQNVPFSYPGTQIDVQPITNYTPTSWSPTVITQYYNAFPSNGPAINHNVFTPAVVVVNSNAPTETVYTQNITWSTWTIPNVPVPASLITLAASRATSGDTDNSFCLYDTFTGYAYQFQGTTVNTSTHVVSVTAAGAYTITGSGWWNQFYPNNITSAGNGGPSIGAASGHEICDGLIGFNETVNNTINHALRFAWPVALARGSSELPQYVFPATATDGTGTNGVSNDAPYGALLVVDPSLTDTFLTTTYSFNSHDLAVIHALQKYGAYLSDTDGSSAMAFQAAADGQSTSIYGFSAWSATFVRDHMWFVSPPFPTALDTRFKDNLLH